MCRATQGIGTAQPAGGRPPLREGQNWLRVAQETRRQKRRQMAFSNVVANVVELQLEPEECLRRENTRPEACFRAFISGTFFNLYTHDLTSNPLRKRHPTHVVWGVNERSRLEFKNRKEKVCPRVASNTSTGVRNQNSSPPSDRPNPPPRKLHQHT